MIKKTAYVQGIKAEARALDFLLKKGFMCLERRYKTPYGEIDLVMQDEQYIVAVEVKFRKNINDCHYSISEKQKERISNALLHYIQSINENSSFLRFDVVLLSAHEEIIYYKNAW